MNPILVIELAVVALVLWLLVTQVVLPSIRGTKLFPLFTTREAKLQEALATARQEREEARLESRIAAERSTKDKTKPQGEQQ